MLVNKKRATQGVLSIGVPGTVYGMWEVHKKFGSLPWSKLLAPAIELAEDGFLISPFMADALNKRYKKLGKYKNFIGFTDDPIVSSDVIGREETMVFDSKATMVTADNLLKTLCWYDNGWGFSKRILDTIKTYHKDVQ